MTEMVTSGSMSEEAETERWTTRREQQRKKLLASGAAGPHRHRAPPRLYWVRSRLRGGWLLAAQRPPRASPPDPPHPRGRGRRRRWRVGDGGRALPPRK